LTSIEGIDESHDNILKFLKQKLNCSGHIKKDKTTGKDIIYLSGDHRNKICQYLILLNVASHGDIIVHGS
jgi:translation initiation factor 1 (eIF-1/SUI1)